MRLTFLSFILLFSLISCSNDDDNFATSAYTFPNTEDPLIPYPTFQNNPITKEGVALGKKLFYDKRLSGDNTMSCNSCHKQEFAFATDQKVEKGIDDIAGTRNSMPLFNLIWNTNQFFWDGRAITLEEQTQMPVEDPIEMHETWENAISEIKADELYPKMFKEAFNVSTHQISQHLAGKAMSQFLRTLISDNSKYDKVIRGEAQFTNDELAGFGLFKTEGPEDGISSDGADCFHCHGKPLFTNNQYINNGLDPEGSFADLGKEAVSGDMADKAKFRVPTLRNLLYTAPYMHDGRFATLEEVLDHYNTGLHYSNTLDPNLKKHTEFGLLLTAKQKEQLLAFLKTLSDPDFITNPEYKPES